MPFNNTLIQYGINYKFHILFMDFFLHLLLLYKHTHTTLIVHQAVRMNHLKHLIWKDVASTNWLHRAAIYHSMAIRSQPRFIVSIHTQHFNRNKLNISFSWTFCAAFNFVHSFDSVIRSFATLIKQLKMKFFSFWHILLSTKQNPFFVTEKIPYVNFQKKNDLIWISNVWYVKK